MGPDRVLLLFTGLCGLSAAQSAAALTSSPAFNETLLAAVNATEYATTCSDCYTILEILKPVAELGDEAFAELAVQYCLDLDEYSPDVCEGLYTLMAPSVAYALRQMDIPSRPAEIFCNTLYTLCSQPTVENYTVPVQAPTRNITGRPAPSNESSIYVVHISDLHVDHNYTVGASYNCSEPTCCHSPEYNVGNATAYAAGPNGEYYCDSPQVLEDAQFAAIEKLVPDRAFTIATGDIAAEEWATTDSIILSDIDIAYTRMQRLGQVFPAIGNHDANPVNAFPPAGVRTVYNNTYDYDAHASLWEPWIGAAAADQVRTNQGTYTTTYGATKLRIISINTLGWMGSNWWIYNTTMPRDPSGMLAFMAKWLQHAETHAERVWIIGHIPPGRSDALYDYSAYLDQLVRRYHATIAAMFWGHTHRDSFEISYADYSEQSANGALAVGYIAPSLTPTSGNPNFRVYEVDPVTFGVRDYSVWVADMSAKDYQVVGPVWEAYYTAKTAYGSLLEPPYVDANAELTPAFWNNVTDLFEADDEVFQDYYARKQRGWDYVPCTGECKSDELCELRSAQSQYGCVGPAAGSDDTVARRDVGTMRRGRSAKGDECGRSVMRDLLFDMAGDAGGVGRRAEQVIARLRR